MSDDEQFPEKPTKAVIEGANGESVGYRNPPRKTQFQKGRPSANPKGRPKKDRSFSRTVRDVFSEMHEVEDSRSGKSKRVDGIELLVRRLKNQAIRGSVQEQRVAVQLLKDLDRNPPPKSASELAADAKKAAKANKAQKETRDRIIEALEDVAARRRDEYEMCTLYNANNKEEYYLAAFLESVRGADVSTLRPGIAKVIAAIKELIGERNDDRARG